MRKVAFFCGNLNHGGGTERVLTVVANALAYENFEVHLINLWGGDNPFFEVDLKIKQTSLFLSKVSFVKEYCGVVRRLRKYLKNNKIDSIVSVESSQSLYSLPAVFGLQIRHINWEHFNFGVDLNFKPRRIARQLAALFSDEIVVLTHRDIDLWRKGSIMRSGIRCIFNPIPFDLPEHVGGVLDNKFVAVGRLTYQKGYDLLLSAWARSKYTTTNSRLYIVGEGEDRHMLERMCRDLGLLDSVVLCGSTKDVSSFYRGSKWFCLSSRFEGLPMVLLEASAWGLPIISFDCDTGPAEVVTADSGFLCASGDVDDFARALNLAMEINDCKYFEMSRRATEAVDKFFIKPIINQWIQLLR